MRLPRRPRRRLFSPCAEAVEPRLLLATFLVTTTADNGDDTAPTPGSLREAILQSVANDEADTILFDLVGPGPFAIQPPTALPEIAGADPVAIDATEMPAYAGTPLVVVDGSQVSDPFTNGLVVSAPGSTVAGIAVVGFSASGLQVMADGATIRANYLGVDPRTMQAVPNALHGLDLQSSFNTIGGMSAADRNLISGNGTNGLRITFGTDNVVLNNLIGTSDGTTDQNPATLGALPNGDDGIFVQFSFNNIIGLPGAGNVIAANRGSGIFLADFADNNTIRGNGIGTTLFGGSSIGGGGFPIPGNNRQGIRLENASSNTIGGGGPGDGNVISSNLVDGISLVNSSGALIAGNQIGTDLAGRTARPNGGDGVSLLNSNGNTIGGDASSGNLIAANVGRGIALIQSGSTGNLVAGNRVGVDSTGLAALGNGGDGIVLSNAPGNTIGAATTTDADRNLIVANGGNGILVVGESASGNQLLGNLVGVRADGAPLGNGGDGIRLLAPGNTVGGTAPGAGNVLGANRGSGVAIAAGPLPDGFDPVTPAGNLIQGNRIGVAGSGASVGLGNVRQGIDILDAPQTTVGGTDPGAGNVIAANLQSGIHVGGASTSVLIQGNFVGLDPQGGAARQGNLLQGIHLDGVSGATIGGAQTGAGNTLADNGANGLLIERGSGNLIRGNTIGTDPTGATRRGNGQSGVAIQGGSGNVIGGSGAGEGNVIAANLGNGVLIVGPAAGATSPGSGNVVRGNRIGTDPSGQVGLGNGLAGLAVQDSPGNILGGVGPLDGNLVSGNGQNGVVLAGAAATGNLVQGNRIGTDAAGLRGIGNAQDGVLVDSAPGNTIGGTTAEGRNLVAANGANGVEIRGATATGNLVQGNRIGTDAAGLGRIGNGQHGVALAAGSSANTIGGDAATAGNLISANGANGVDLSQGATANRVLGNRIGTNAGGTAALGNGFAGVALNNAPGNMVGSNAPGTGNQIAGNSANGVLISGGLATGNLVQGNRIGTDGTGSVPLGNLAAGITIDAAPGNQIGGGAAGEGNVIAANQTFGLLLVGGGATGNQVAGNWIGTNPSGAVGLGNALDGVLLNGAPGNTIGALVGAGNVISGNGGNGIRAQSIGGTGGLAILGNLIGLTPDGRAGLGNAFDGILLDGVVGAQILAGATPNAISGNGRDGVELVNGTQGTRIQGNRIGTDASGSIAVGNRGVGLLLSNSPGNTLGGTAPGAGNLISANATDGVQIAGAASSGNLVQGNRIGTDGTGQRALGNGNNGVTISGAGSNLIGGSPAGAGNLISANGGDGIQVIGPGADGNQLLANMVGTDLAGSVALGNAVFGISLEGATATVVGSSLISANALGGVQIAGFGATGNRILGSTIGTDLAGRVALSNTIGIFINGAGGNSVGGEGPGEGNLISGNASAGVYLFGRFASGNVILGNRIGTDRAGQAPIGAGGGTTVQVVGVLIDQAPGLDLQDNPAPGNTVGGVSPGARNVISGNSVGVEINGADSVGNVVLGNLIGPTAGGGAGAGNGVGVYINGAPRNRIGGAAANIISGNSGVGVYILGGTATDNVVAGNLIGLGPDGRRLPNQNGVYIENAPGNTIGGATTADANVISANQVVGVYILGGQSTDNLVVRNRIGLAASKPNAKGGPFGNRQYGVLLYNAPDNVVARQGRSANKIAGSGIANFREFTGRSVSANKPRVKTSSARVRPAGTVHRAGVPSGPRGVLLAKRPAAR